MPLSKVNKKWLKFGDWPLFNFYLSNALQKMFTVEQVAKGQGQVLNQVLSLAVELHK